MKPIFLWVTLLCGVVTYAQTITGKVVTQTNSPVENVAVFNKNSGEHTHTDASGAFALQNNTENDEIYISHLGFETVIFPVTSKSFSSEINIV